jgi:thiol-disulfide isomerase/thioredoxin
MIRRFSRELPFALLFGLWLPTVACSDGQGPATSGAEAAGAAEGAHATTPGAAGPPAKPAPSPAVPPPSGLAASEFRKAPAFELSNVAGGTLRLADYAGKVVLLDFWATWCGPCRAGIPHLNELYRQHRESGFEIVGISVDRGRGNVSGLETVRQFTTRMPIAYPLAMADAATVNAYGGIQSIPTAFLVDASGRIRKTYVGLQPKDVFAKDIQALLAERGESKEKI